ncbi:6-carboxy-5,8-tetrahydropterin synthase [Striga asiatica]|uniref:6-carboxy-5,8-tetrahydropterin synthase n=1 Tax=Striga asiatica TaxID=4170 RepID=A0A5A7PRR3_STRAF|nr:6-carboxy-5,8-tetrahydropterin synthase [Striga asiatica]
MDGSLVLHRDEKENGTSPDDILVRRLKNRERQRRYRARKRHQADLIKTSIDNQSSPHIHYQPIPSEFISVPVEVESPEGSSSPDHLTRVHCQRDWKKDARNAHMHKKQESGSIDKADLPSDNLSTVPVDDDARNRVQPSRRHWKAEARNKKNLE